MAKRKPLVGVVMGSESDLAVVQRCLTQLQEFGIAFEVRVISAHRVPQEVHEYANGARKRGLKVIVTAAGMSAALGGAMAAGTTLPVIGIPVNSGPLGGVDAALTMMQMPPGVPVGCMAIGAAGATNAAVYAAQIIATSDARLAAKLEKFKQAQARKVAAADTKVRKEL